jgi:hypothetical protein
MKRLTFRITVEKISLYVLQTYILLISEQKKNNKKKQKQKNQLFSWFCMFCFGDIETIITFMKSCCSISRFLMWYVGRDNAVQYFHLQGTFSISLSTWNNSLLSNLIHQETFSISLCTCNNSVLSNFFKMFGWSKLNLSLRDQDYFKYQNASVL